ncbi:phosphoribosylanthranilate isomerase [bacterium]|nr:MAG: phosphoribosylanthranilate isomerase [bacterium]
MVRVKICGITNLEDALNAVDAGCDALGFVFYKKSPRYIAPQAAIDIIRNLPAKVIKIGVFVNAQEKNIRHTARICHLDQLQFHGNESPEFCARFKEDRVIKAFRIRDRIDLKNILKYKTSAYLFDTFNNSKAGGTGKKFNWSLLKDFSKIGKGIFLSGGLNAANVKSAISIAQPEWVDASSGIEVGPGRKDARKLKKFIQAAKL